MLYLAHRGLWKNPVEKNSKDALLCAFESGFGVETDIRDKDGVLVVSHDLPGPDALPLADILSHYASNGHIAPIAINVKSDGLSILLAKMLAEHSIENYFCFDMSTPEMLAYRRNHLRYFTRQSEHERHPALLDDACGVWMDMFESDWIRPRDIAEHLEREKLVALVSPELHGRSYLDFWETLRNDAVSRESGLMLCTDYPEEALRFFNE